MAVIGTFSSFTTARLGIYASQASLNITGNNIANINTEGYTRQRLDLVSLYSKGTGKYANIFNTNIGYGVLTESRSQLRDPFLDIRYRNENSNLAASTETYNGLYQISHTLDEVNKGTGNDEGNGVIQANLANFLTALQKLKVNVGSPEFDREVRGQAESLCTFFKEAANALQSVYDGKMDEFTQSIKETNLLLTDIRDLNEQIRTAALYGDNALELRDQRNLDLDRLSELMHINVEYSMERIDQFTEVEKLTVTIAGSKGPDGKPVKLIDGIYGGQISLQEKEPLMNPNYNALKIRAAEDQARADAEVAFPLSAWDGWLEEQMKAAQAAAEANHLADDPDWKAEVAERVQAAQDKAEAAVRKANKNATPEELAKLVEEAREKAQTDTEAEAEEERLALIQDEVKSAEKALKRQINEARQTAIEDAVKKDPRMIEAIEKYGKYLTDDKPGAKATNDLYETDENGLPVKDADGNYQYIAKVYDNDKLLLQVEPLMDRRDRLMTDSYNVSKKSEVVELNDTVLYGKLQSQRELLTEEGDYASNDDLNRDGATGKDMDPPRLSGDPDASIKRGIPFYQKALDSLAKQFAEEFNQANQLPATTVYQMQGDNFIDADDNVVTYNGVAITADMVTKVLKDEDGNAILDDDGNEVRVPYVMGDAEYGQAGEMLTILAQKAAKDPLYEFYDGGVLFSNNGNTNDPSDIKASNISVSNAWATESVHILNDKRADSYNEDGTVNKHSSRNENIQHLITLFNKQLEYDARDVQSDSAATMPIFKGSFREVYSSIEGILGTDQNIMAGKMNNYAVMTLSLENDRQSVSGVDLNDEATSMMQYSKSYSAACRLLTTIDSMLDTLINGTAR